MPFLALSSWCLGEICISKTVYRESFKVKNHKNADP